MLLLDNNRTSRAYEPNRGSSAPNKNIMKKKYHFTEEIDAEIRRVYREEVGIRSKRHTGYLKDWLLTTGYEILIIGLFTILITLVIGNILYDI